VAASSLKALGLLALAALLQSAHSAQPKLSHDPIDFTADSVFIDQKKGTSTWHKVRIAQDNIVLTADSAQSNGTAVEHAFDDSRWTFRGSVRLSRDEAVLNADEAQVTFLANALMQVVANGKPANFQQKLQKTGKLAQGHSDNIEYDVPKGVIRLSKNAWLTNGDNETRAESIKYNIQEQTVAADSAEGTTKGVHIIITQPPQKPPVNPPNP
jgi:lipopolysaccharide export system protein LptA